MAAPGFALWDWPVRLCHLGFILLVPLQWWTWKEGHMDWHVRLGLLFLGLVLFRILWGFAGSETARFRQFLVGPAAIRAYLAHGRWHGLGHNPLGGLSVVAILLLLLAQASLGLFATDTDGLVYGPLSHLVSFEAASAAGEWHERTFNLLLALIALHLSAIAVHTMLLGHNLIGPMVTGRKQPDDETPPGTPAPVIAPSARAFALALPVALLVWWVGAGAPLPGG
jgi:cytochrome b